MTGVTIWTALGLLWGLVVILTHRHQPFYLLDIPLFRLLDGLEVERISTYKLYFPNIPDQTQYLFYSSLFHAIFGLMSGLLAGGGRNIWNRIRGHAGGKTVCVSFLVSWNLFLLFFLLLLNRFQIARKGALIPPFILVILSLKLIASLILALIVFLGLKRVLYDATGGTDVPVASYQSKLMASFRIFLYAGVSLILITGISGYLMERSALTHLQDEEHHASTGRDSDGLSARNVILIIIDTLRADHLGCYGYERQITPNLDELAHDGVRFTSCFSQAPWTIPSIMSIMTSLYPTVSGVMDNRGRLDPMRQTLAESFRDGGYATAGIVSHTFVDHRFGFGDGFETFEDERVIHRPAGEVTETAISMIENIKDNGFFFFIHYFDPHFPYEPPAPYDTLATAAGEKSPTTWKEMKRFARVSNPLPEKELERSIALYDGEIAYTDAMIGRLIDYLKTSGIYDETVIALAADHGEEFKDHGSMGHTRTLYDELIHVPLIIKLPGSVRSGTVVSSQVRSIDIAPTLLGLGNIRAPSEFIGVDLSPFWSDSGIVMDLPAFSETSRHAVLRSIRRSGYKYIQDIHRSFYHIAPGEPSRSSGGELYDLKADPGERDNLGGTGSPIRAELREELFRLNHTNELERKWIPKKGGAQEVTYDQETLDRLKTLGYVQ